MNPDRYLHATLVDLLERALDRGLILDADLIIHVAGVPLLGVKLRTALAGMETMLKYGIWQDWEKAIRAIATRSTGERTQPGLATIPGAIAGQEEENQYECH